MVTFVALREVRAGGKVLPPGEVVPGAERWPALQEEVRAGNVLPVLDSGKPCEWVTTESIPGYGPDAVVANATERPDFQDLVTLGLITWREPVKKQKRR